MMMVVDDDNGSKSKTSLSSDLYDEQLNMGM